MARYLVTGGGGFIGSHLVRALVARGDQVNILDDTSTGTPTRVADLGAAVAWIAGDVRDPVAVARACQGVEVVFHQAAIASVPRSVGEPLLTHAVNVTGTLHVLEAARAAGARRVVFASSCAIYGDDPAQPKREDMPPQPRSPYAVQKLAAETYCRLWAALYGLETVALRYFNVFGPGQDPTSEYSAAIPRFIAAVQAGHAPVIYGDGEQARDFVYVGDVVAANLRAAQAEGVSGGVFNIGTGQCITLNQLIAHLAEITGQSIHPHYAPARRGDVRVSRADIRLSQTQLGFTPSLGFTEGLRHVLAGQILPNHGNE